MKRQSLVPEHSSPVIEEVQSNLVLFLTQPKYQLIQSRDGNQIFLILKPFSVSDGCSTTVKQADLSIDLGGLELAGKSTFAYWFFVPFLFLQVGSGQGHHPKSKSCSTFSILLVTYFAQRQPVPASQSWSSWKGLHLRSGNLASKVRKS